MQNCSLHFVRRLNYKTIKLQRFESWILLSSSGAKGPVKRQTKLLGPLVELASDMNEVDHHHKCQESTEFRTAAISALPRFRGNKYEVE